MGWKIGSTVPIATKIFLEFGFTSSASNARTCLFAANAIQQESTTIQLKNVEKRTKKVNLFF
jgi:hypothetical protein